MSAQRPPGVPTVKAEDRYHHGDLRQALIALARDTLRTSSPESITLRSLSETLGVSQGAPYRHFSSREALLSAVAEDGFRRFRARIEDTLSNPGDDASERTCLEYIAFAQENPGVYGLMFLSDPAQRPENESLRQASHEAFETLLIRLHSGQNSQSRMTTALWIWSTLHGLAMLDLKGHGAGPVKDPNAVQHVIRKMIATLQDE